MTLIAGQRIRVDNILWIPEPPVERDPALHYTVGLVREHDASAHLLHTSGSPVLDRRFSHLLANHAYERGWRDIGPGRVAREESASGGQIGIRLDQMTAGGDIDLIVLGWRSRSDAQRRAVVEQIFSATTLPVLVLGPGIRDGDHIRTVPQAVLHATDFSPHATAAAEYAFSWAQEYQSRLTLLHVVEGVNAWSVPERSGMEEPFLRWMSELVGGESPLWCETEHLVHIGKPGTTILATARELDTDLIVIGRAGLDGATQVQPGSTTLRIMREAPCPVLVVSSAVAKREPLPEARDRRSATPAVAA